jgi:hypothetical protein
VLKNLLQVYYNPITGRPKSYYSLITSESIFFPNLITSRPQFGCTFIATLWRVSKGPGLHGRPQQKKGSALKKKSFLATSEGAKEKKTSKNIRGKDEKTQRNTFDKKTHHRPVQKSKRPAHCLNSKTAFFQIFHLGAKMWGYYRHYEGVTE